MPGELFDSFARHLAVLMRDPIRPTEFLEELPSSACLS